MLTKKLAFSILAASLTLIICNTADATVAGPYIGAQAGWGNIHQDNMSNTELNNLVTNALGTSSFSTNSFTNGGNDAGLAGRVFAGYQFNEHLALEAGFTKFHNMSTSADANYTAISSSGTANGSGSIDSEAIDLMVKGIAPLENGIGLYGKIGGAYLMEHESQSVTLNPSGATSSTSNNINKLLPAVAVGISYDISPNIVTDISWMRIQKVGGSDLNSTDLASLGLAYHFG